MVVDVKDDTSDNKGSSIDGIVEMVALSHRVEFDGGKGGKDIPTPSPAIKRNVPGVVRDSARILRSCKEVETGRRRGNASIDDAP